MTGPIGGAGELTALVKRFRQLQHYYWPADSQEVPADEDEKAFAEWANVGQAYRDCADYLEDAIRTLAAKAPQGVPAPQVRELLAVAEWAVYALEHGSSIEVYWLTTVAKHEHAKARDVIAEIVGALAAVSAPVSDDTIHHGMVPPAEIEAIDDREKTKRALDALDRLCDMWAEEVDLERIVKVISGQPDKVRAMLRQSWIEGAYRGRMSAIDYPPREAAAPKPAPPCDHGNATSAPVDTCRMTPECRDRNPLYCPACGSCEHEGHDKTCPNPDDFTVPKPAPLTDCPTCASPAPHLHPSVQHEGEVQPCSDTFHKQATSQNKPEEVEQLFKQLDGVVMGATPAPGTEPLHSLLPGTPVGEALRRLEHEVAVHILSESPAQEFMDDIRLLCRTLREALAAAPLTPDADAIEAPSTEDAPLLQMKPVRRSLAEKAKDEMSEFEKGFPYDAATPAPGAEQHVLEDLPRKIANRILTDDHGSSFYKWGLGEIERLVREALAAAPPAPTDILREKEITVANHIRQAASDGCQCEPCIAARHALAERVREARQQMAMLAADECDGAQVERPSKTLNAAEFNRWITDVGDKIRALGGASDDWWEKSLAKARLEEARWWDEHPDSNTTDTYDRFQRMRWLERAVEGK